MEKYIKQIGFILVLSLGFIACSDKDKASFISDDNSSSKISIVSCSSGTTTINTNDVLVKETDGTQVTISHLSDDTKTVCIVSGNAHLLRDN